MTTTYELYTNENGTPKAVEGKAPAIIERVEALETSVETLEETLDKGVVTSVNGNTGDITPEQTGCLPLRGGTMTGAIGFNGIGYIQCKDSTSNGVQIYGANAFTDGAFLGIYGKDHASRAGWIYANANDGASSKTLIGKPDGTLTWVGKEVERVNSSGNKWIRYENGLQICWGFQSISSSTKITYAVPFTNNVIVQVGGTFVSPSYYYTAIPASSNTTCSFTVVKISSGVVELPPNDAPSFSWLAIGRWK